MLKSARAHRFSEEQVPRQSALPTGARRAGARAERSGSDPATVELANVGRPGGPPPANWSNGRPPGLHRNAVRHIVHQANLRSPGLRVLLVDVARLGGLSALEQPMDLVGGRVPPLAHPVLETR